jgi:TetR/AcrR family transcriptional repressor of nem operon
MARPRSYDAEAVLDAARDLFWSRGYQAASLDELARITGVNKPSLYAAFGDKAGLFRLVLDRYHVTVLALSERVLNGGGSPRRAIRAWLLGFLSFCSGELGARGCLSLNTNLEASVLSPDVRSSIDQLQKNTEALLRAAFDRGKEAGEFAASFDSVGAARALLVAQSGLMVLARGRPPAAETLASMERLLNSIVPEAAS